MPHSQFSSTNNFAMLTRCSILAIVTTLLYLLVSVDVSVISDRTVKQSRTVENVRTTSLSGKKKN